MVLDRRRFLTGGGPSATRADEVVQRAASCGILVQAHPDRLDQAVAAIKALGRIDLVQHGSPGRLTFALEAADAAGVSLALNAISQLPGVLSATLAAPSRVAPSRNGVGA
jgi:nitrate reductase NapAB chaperone NapD